MAYVANDNIKEAVKKLKLLVAVRESGSTPSNITSFSPVASWGEGDLTGWCSIPLMNEGAGITTEDGDSVTTSTLQEIQISNTVNINWEDFSFSGENAAIYEMLANRSCDFLFYQEELDKSEAVWATEIIIKPNISFVSGESSKFMISGTRESGTFTANAKVVTVSA